MLENFKSKILNWFCSQRMNALTSNHVSNFDGAVHDIYIGSKIPVTT